MDPRDEPDHFEALELIVRLCDESDFPRPDRMIGHDDGQVTFVWDEADFTATWDLAALLASPGADALLKRE